MGEGIPSGATDKWLQAVDFNQQLAVMEKEHAQEMRDTLLSFLDVLDSFDRCFSAMDQTGGTSSVAQSWSRSFEGIRRQLQRTLERAGVSFMNCRGGAFDPHKHEAIEVRARPDLEEGMVIEEVIRGCEWRGEVLRQAKVVVSRKSR